MFKKITHSRMSFGNFKKVIWTTALFILGTAPLNAIIINVKLPPYNASGNGSSDDTTAIQRAIDENPNSEILLKNGTFKVSATLRLKSGRTLRGDNGTLYSSTNFGMMISCDSNVDILNLKINGNNQSTTGIYIGAKKKYISILNCELYNFRGNSTRSAYAINIRDWCSDISIIKTKIHDIDGGGNGIQADSIGANRGILIRGVSRLLIDLCEIYNIGPWEDGDCIQVQAPGASYVTIRNSVFHNFMKRAIKIQATDVKIINNFISCDYDEDGVNAPHSGISILANRCKVIGNTIILKRAFTAIDVAHCKDVIVDNNYTDIYGYDADHCRTSAIRALYFNACNNSTISGNTSFNYYSGVNIRNSYNNNIKNNKILVSNPFPLWLTYGSTGSNSTFINNIDSTTVLQGFWRFNSTSDITTTFDFADNNYQGTPVGFTSDESVEGVIGSALSFDGSDDFINIGDELDMGTADFSICAWVKSTSSSTGNRNGIIYKRVTKNSTESGYGLNMPNGVFQFHIADGENYRKVVAGSSGKYNDGDWHHVAAVANRGTDIKIYIDGQLEASNSETNVGNIDSTTNLAIGGLTLNGQTCYNGFKGVIDEVMIFDEAITADEINKMYQNQEIK